MSNRANPAVPDPGARHPALSGTGNRYTGGALQTVAGLLILAMVLLTILDNLAPWRFSDPLRWFAGISAWLATLLLIRQATFFLRIQVGILLGAGLGMILLAHGRGVAIDPLSAISTNTGLLSMIAAVGFLRLVALPRPGEVRRLPVGRRAYLQTLASIGVFKFRDQHFRPGPDRGPHPPGKAAGPLHHAVRHPGVLRHVQLVAPSSAPWRRS